MHIASNSSIRILNYSFRSLENQIFFFIYMLHVYSRTSQLEIVNDSRKKIKITMLDENLTMEKCSTIFRFVVSIVSYLSEVAKLILGTEEYNFTRTRMGSRIFSLKNGFWKKFLRFILGNYLGNIKFTIRTVRKKD